MRYQKRARCEGDVYHVFTRGTGQRIIFEDDLDRKEFLRRIVEIKANIPGDIYAWCLMGNHYHMVVHMTPENLAELMCRLNGGYARFFNVRHGRAGHLFGGRYDSEPVRSSEQLLAAVRYVHRNPVGAGLSRTCDYRWSSYGEYLGSPDIAETSLVLSLLGGQDAFSTFHESESGGGGDSFRDVPERSPVSSRPATQDEASDRAKRILGEGTFEALPGLPKAERDGCLHSLAQAGLSIRQIALVTGVGRGIVQKAVRECDHSRRMDG